MKKLLFMGVVAAMALVSSAATIQNGESVVFLGDWVTDIGWRDGAGFVKLCEAAFKANGIDAKVSSVSGGGTTSDNLADMFERHALRRKPTYLAINCGVNDVRRGKGGVPFARYQENFRALVDKAQAAGCKVLLLTATMIGEDADNKENKTLAAYNDFLRALAKEKGCPLVDLNAAMMRLVAERRVGMKADEKGRYPNTLTRDGVIPNFICSRMLALEVLKGGFGFTAAELAKSAEAFAQHKVSISFFAGNVPFYYQHELALKMTGAEFMRLNDAAIRQNTSAHDFITQHLPGKIWAPRFEQTGREKIEALIKNEK